MKILQVFFSKCTYAVKHVPFRVVPVQTSLGNRTTWKIGKTKREKRKKLKVILWNSKKLEWLRFPTRDLPSLSASSSKAYTVTQKRKSKVPKWSFILSQLFLLCQKSKRNWSPVTEGSLFKGSSREGTSTARREYSQALEHMLRGNHPRLMPSDWCRTHWCRLNWC